MMDKIIMAKMATDAGLSVPFGTRLLDKNIDVKNLSYPCIIKFLSTINGGKNQIIIENQDQMSEYLNTHDDISGKFIQAFIDKDFEFQLIGCATHNDIVIPGFSKILRPCKNSNTSFLLYQSLSEINIGTVVKC